MNLLDLNRMANAMHKAKQEREALEHEFPIICQSRFEADFDREFGCGDEHLVKQPNIYAAWDDSGHGRGNFA